MTNMTINSPVTTTTGFLLFVDVPRRSLVFNTRKGVMRCEGDFALRVWASKPTKRKFAKLLVKCGCCDERIEVHYDHESHPTTIEINGVSGSIDNWRELFHPILYGINIQ